MATPPSSHARIVTDVLRLPRPAYGVPENTRTGYSVPKGYLASDDLRPKIWEDRTPMF